MKEQTKKVYSCDHCNRKMFVKGACIKHELVCTKNPINFFACSSCAHLEEIEKEIYVDTFMGGYNRKVKGFICTKLNVNMYPPKAQKLADMYPENFDNEMVMPKECEHKNADLPF